jgi:hypothetical protein
MDRPRRDSRQHNGITLRDLSQPTFATKSANRRPRFLRLPGRREIGRESNSGKPIFERPRLRDAYLRPLPSRRDGGVTRALREDTSASAVYSTLLLMEALQSTVDRQASAA